jgi:hypothetical protein
VKLAVDLVIAEETVDALPEIDVEGVVARSHENEEDTEGDIPIDLRDDRGVEEGPPGSGAS